MKNKIIFFGTPNFSKLILKELVEEKFNITAVVTKPDKPVGRGQKMSSTPVKKFALKKGITILEPKKVKDIKKKLEKLNPDLAIVAAYGQIIPKEILEIPQKGILNIHPSLLPKYRGPTPIQAAILNGDKKTGVTIILMDEKMDHGPILSQKEITITSPTYKELFQKLVNESKKLIVKTIPRWIDGKIELREQNHSNATYTSLLKKEDGKINWNNEAIKIERKVRAYNPWPSTFTYFNSKLLKILKVKILKQDNYSKMEPGKVLNFKDDKLVVQAGEDLLRLKKVQFEGKRKMKDTTFLKGHKKIIGKILN
ncbi:MAG: methionyl-tRNA formyltransferase [Minisyncoccales bacterium]